MLHNDHPAKICLFSFFNFNQICLTIFVQRDLMFAMLKLNYGNIIIAVSTSKKIILQYSYVQTN